MNMMLLKILLILGIVYIGFKLVLLILVTIGKLVLRKLDEEDRDFENHLEKIKKIQDGVIK